MKTIVGDSVNKFFLFGTAKKVGPLRFTSGGSAVLYIQIETCESYLDKDKVRRDRSDRHTILIWGKRAEALAKIVQVGTLISTDGALRVSHYEKNGKRYKKTELLANAISIVRDEVPQ